MEAMLLWAKPILDQYASEYTWLMVSLSSLGALMCLAQMVVAITPSKKDDAKLEQLMSKKWFKTLFDMFKSFAPAQKDKSGFKKSE